MSSEQEVIDQFVEQEYKWVSTRTWKLIRCRRD